MSNANDQVAFWNGAGGERWVRDQRARDAMLAPFGDAAMQAASVSYGEAVLDLGCGCGTTSLALADRVGGAGRVVGLDLSVSMIARAREIAKDRANASFIAGDAAAADLPAGGFDALYSRFGVMFFPDPVGAFAHLRAFLREGARVAFVCWRPLSENPWAKLPADAVAAIVGSPAPSPPDAPGPFSFGAEPRVRSILERAGYAAIELRPFDTQVFYGESLDVAAANVAQLGPAARMLVDRDAATVTLATTAIRESIAGYATPAGVAIPAAAWVVLARRG